MKSFCATAALVMVAVAPNLMGCTPGFLNPKSRQLTYPSDRPADTAAFPTEGYLQVTITTNMQGLVNSWADASQVGSMFKSVAVTVQTEASGPEVPVMTLDLNGKVKEGSELIDKEITRSVYVKLDNNTTKTTIAGTTKRPSVTVAVSAVPFTLADVADKLVKVGKTALQTVGSVPGGSTLSSALPPGSIELASSILDVIGSQATEYKDVSWRRRVEASVESQGDLRSHRANWIFVPTPVNVVSQTGEAPVGPNPQPVDDTGEVILPELYACDQNGKTSGKLAHICDKDLSGNLRVYTRYAWISLGYEILSEPSSDVIRDPTETCADLADAAKVDVRVKRVSQVALTHAHQTERELWLKEYLAAANFQAATTREAQLVALERWFDTGNAITVNVNGADVAFGPEPKAHAPKPTWTSLSDSREWLRQCATSKAATGPLRLALIAAHSLWKSQSAASTTATEAQLYEIIDAFDIAIPNNVSQDDALSGSLLRRRREAEENLYKKAFAPITAATVMKAKMAQFIKCQYCQLEAHKLLDTLPPPSPPPNPVVRDPGFERTLQKAGYDIAALEEYRKKSAALEFASSTHQSSAKIDDARAQKDAAEKVAIDALEKKLGLSKDDAKNYLIP